MRQALAWALVAIWLAPAPARAEGDAAAGKTVFNKCMICHSAKQGENRVGPSLFGIVGRPAHSITSYTYSPAMAAYDATWDAATLDHYLIEPRATVPGTKMIFPGLKNEQDRQNLIAFLATLK